MVSSQAMDVGTLKSLPADTIRTIVWILSFLTFGFATGEFEVTSDRLGTYRPEEHIEYVTHGSGLYCFKKEKKKKEKNLTQYSNPKDYADNQDARQYDSRLRGPVRQVELDIDPETGMKNYISNERGDWDTSARYVKYSLARSIHYGRLYTSGSHREEDLAEALRCLGQGLHTLEDFAAHTNYCELALREMGFLNVFPHTGVSTEINLHGRRVFPLVTGTFGMVDFFHSVLGEATDHFTQSEVNEMDVALGDAQANSSSGSLGVLTGLLGKVPGTRELVVEAEDLKQRSEAQETSNRSIGSRSGYATNTDTTSRGDKDNVLANFDPNKTIAQIYPILSFRDKVVRKLTSIIEKIPGLEAAVEKISETLTIFIMSLLAPFIRPIINAASSSLQTGSAGVIDASGKHQYEPWTDPFCTDPTHSLLSKDHFANILNEPAGHVAAAIVRYVAPRVLYAWDHPGVSETEVTNDCLRVFHHPAIRDMHNEAHRTMFEAVQGWLHANPNRPATINDVLSSQGVREGKNTGGVSHTHKPAGFSALGSHSHGDYHQQHQHQAQGYGFESGPGHGHGHSQGQGHGSSIPWDQLNKLPIPGISKLSNFIPGGLAREAEPAEPNFHYTDHSLGGGASGGHSSDYYQGQGHGHHDPYGYSHGQSHGYGQGHGYGHGYGYGQY